MMGFASRYHFDGFIMLNLYPKRTPYPNKLPLRIDRQLADLNRQLIEDLLVEHPEGSLLAAWGSIIELRPYLKTQLQLIQQLTNTHHSKWLKIGELTKSGHPRHPSRAAYAEGLNDFDIKAYLEKMQESSPIERSI